MNHIRNRVPQSMNGVTHYVLLTDIRPSLKYVRVFGCAVFVLKMTSITKFYSRAPDGVCLQTFEHGVYEVLVSGADDIPE